MSLKHLLALAGLVAVAACQGPIEPQRCWLFDKQEHEYRCGAEDLIDQQSPGPYIHPVADEGA